MPLGEWTLSLPSSEKEEGKKPNILQRTKLWSSSLPRAGAHQHSDLPLLP